eukprot:SAG31_NODE_7236_length_1747_cov_6.008495_2_plen_145_part_00
MKADPKANPLSDHLESTFRPLARVHDHGQAHVQRLAHEVNTRRDEERALLLLRRGDCRLEGRPVVLPTVARGTEAPSVEHATGWWWAARGVAWARGIPPAQQADGGSRRDQEWGSRRRRRGRGGGSEGEVDRVDPEAYDTVDFR